MKKLASSVPPFLVLIFPVLLFVTLSFVISKEKTKILRQTNNYNLGAQTKTVIAGYPKSFIHLFLK